MSRVNIQDLQKKNTATFSELQSLKAKAADEKRDYTDEEVEQMDKMFADMDANDAAIAKEERNLKIESYEKRMTARPSEPSVKPSLNDGTELRFGEWAEELATASLPGTFTFDLADIETRALSSATTANAAGNVIADEPMASIEKALKMFAPVRNIAQVFQHRKGGDWPVPVVNDTDAVGAQYAESAEIADDEDPEFNQFVLKAYRRSSKIIRVPYEVEQDFNEDLPSLIGTLGGERLARGNNRMFTVGNGTNQPQGVVIGAHDSGVETAAATTAAVDVDILFDVEAALDPAYQTNATWMVGPAAYASIRKINSANQLVWQPNLREGAPGSILGYPYVVNSDMPAIGTANRRFLVFGDFSKFYIREIRGINIVRNPYLYQGNGEVGYEVWGRWDSKVINAGTNPLIYAKNKA